MISIINNSKSGILANQERLNTISQNIVNSQTNGYKKLNTSFSDLLPDSLNRNYIPRNKDLNIGGGVRATNPIRVFTQGALKNTNIATDLAIDGQGLFSLTTPNGDTMYTRSSDFAIDGGGKITDLNGNVLNIDFDEGKTYDNAGLTNQTLKVSDKGVVFSNDTRVGKIQLYTVTGDNDLISNGDSLYSLKEGIEAIQTNDYNIMQGYVEVSNVDMIDEMNNMLATQRAIQFNSKGLQTANDMWGMINNLQSR